MPAVNVAGIACHLPRAFSGIDSFWFMDLLTCIHFCCTIHTDPPI
jgi:hypothetical protein